MWLVTSLLDIRDLSTEKMVLYKGIPIDSSIGTQYIIKGTVFQASFPGIAASALSCITNSVATGLVAYKLWWVPRLPKCSPSSLSHMGCPMQEVQKRSPTASGDYHRREIHMWRHIEHHHGVRDRIQHNMGASVLKSLLDQSVEVVFRVTLDFHNHLFSMARI